MRINPITSFQCFTSNELNCPDRAATVQELREAELCILNNQKELINQQNKLLAQALRAMVEQIKATVNCKYQYQFTAYNNALEAATELETYKKSNNDSNM